MMDRLEALLQYFSVSARVFQAGTLCGTTDLAGAPGMGQLHLIRAGEIRVEHGDGSVSLHIDQPSLLLYPRPLPRRFLTDPVQGADLVCAHLHFGGGVGDPIAASLPPVVCLPLVALEGGSAVLALLFDEAFKRNCGRQAMLDRLFEVVLIQVLRHLMESNQVRAGMLAGLSHPRLRQALAAIHAEPALDWSLEQLAARAGMSRSVFARSFRQTVGCTTGTYLQRWRVSLARQALAEGKPLKLVAGQVGYGSEAALSRAFKAQVGLSPRQWTVARLAAQHGDGIGPHGAS